MIEKATSGSSSWKQSDEGSIRGQALQAGKAEQTPASAKAKAVCQEVINPTGDSSKPDIIPAGGLETGLKEVMVEDTVGTCPVQPQSLWVFLKPSLSSLFSPNF